VPFFTLHRLQVSPPPHLLNLILLLYRLRLISKVLLPDRLTWMRASDGYDGNDPARVTSLSIDPVPPAAGPHSADSSVWTMVASDLQLSLLGDEPWRELIYFCATLSKVGEKLALTSLCLWIIFRTYIYFLHGKDLASITDFCHFKIIHSITI